MSYVHHLLLYESVTPLHVGCGQDVGVVDLPVIRERTTGFPFLPGSGIRGALRVRVEDERERDHLFGPEAGGDEESRYAGSVAVHDAKLLLFPVRSDPGPYLWLTCPAAIRRLEREARVLLDGDGSADSWGLTVAAPGEEELLAPADLTAERSHVDLEELRFRAASGAAAVEDRRQLAAWATRLGERVGRAGELSASTVLVSDRVFHHFARYATVVVQRNALDSAKTVRDGHLFSLEAVPPEAVFFGFVGAAASRWTEVDRAAPDGDQGDGQSSDEAPAKAESRLTPQQVLARLKAALWGASGTPLVTHLGGDEATGLGVTALHWDAPAKETP